MTIALHVNGDLHEIDADPSTPLLYVLRNELAWFTSTGARRFRVFCR
jgi:aerobic-type carbon monoxide dehydrogenase small subunit (CoxS/CutS family)